MAQAALPKRKPVSRMKRNEAIAGLAFVLPWIISLLVFTTYPVLASFYYSFTQYSIIQAPKWIGLENYVTMFTRHFPCRSTTARITHFWQCRLGCSRRSA